MKEEPFQDVICCVGKAFRDAAEDHSAFSFRGKWSVQTLGATHPTPNNTASHPRRLGSSATLL